MNNDPEVIQDLVADFVDRRLDGETISVDEYCALHPLAGDLRARLEIFERLGASDRESLHFEPGEVIGDYRFGEVLGRGGMGTVYEAVDLTLGRPVAVKIGRGGAGAIDPRFAREAKAIARLRHPNIVSILSLDMLAGRPAIVMDYVDGESLADRLRRGSDDDPAQIMERGAALARALGATHRARILHRDIKPSNVLLTRSGMPMLADFGLARIQDELTLTGSTADLGTPTYMSPEQVDGLRLTDATDIYSLGATLFEWLTGRPPFRSDRRSTLYHSILNHEPPLLTHLRPEATDAMARIIGACLAKDPARRYPSADALAADLVAASRGEPISIAPPTRIRRLIDTTIRRGRFAVALIAIFAIASLAIGLTQVGLPWDDGEKEGDRAVRADRAVAEARLAMQQVRFGDAIAVIENGLQLSESDGRLHFLRADARLRQMALTNEGMEPEKIRSILSDFDRAIGGGERTAAAYLARAHLLRYLGDAESSDLDYETGVALPHVSGADHFYRARIERANEDYEAALLHYREAVRLQPAALIPYLQLALFEAQVSDDMQIGLGVLDACDRIHPGHPEAEAVRAWLWLCDTREEVGEAKLRDLIALDPPSLRAVDYLHRWLVADERTEELPALYDELHARDPKSMQWQFNRIGARIQNGELGDVESLIAGLEASHPDDSVVWTMRLVLDVYVGRVDEAVAGLERIAVVPGHPHLLRSIRSFTMVLRGDDALGEFFGVLDLLE